MDEAPFSQEALDANEGGRLTDEQARGWQRMARERRSGVRRAAYVPAAIGVVLLIATGPASKAAIRTGVGVACLVVAVVILAAAGRDALTADVREGRVDAVEGAIGKHFVQARSAGGSTYYLDIAGHHLRTGRGAYDAAPDAGVVRAYYLPRSRRLVNLEHLPDRPLPTGPGGPQQILESLTGALRRHDPTALAEARASAAALANAIKGTATRPTESSRPLADGLVGSWTNPLMTVTFAQDGTATVTVLGGAQRVGHWAIDAGGHLLTDVSGTMEPTEAWVTGDELTIKIEERSLAFARLPSS